MSLSLIFWLLWYPWMSDVPSWWRWGLDFREMRWGGGGKGRERTQKVKQWAKSGSFGENQGPNTMFQISDRGGSEFRGLWSCEEAELEQNLSEIDKELGGGSYGWLSRIQGSVDNLPFMVRQIRVFGRQAGRLAPWAGHTAFIGPLSLSLISYRDLFLNSTSAYTLVEVWEIWCRLNMC